MITAYDGSEGAELALAAARRLWPSREHVVASVARSAVIVVGSRGRSAHREVLLGSVAMARLHHAHRAVLAVPPPMRLVHAAELTALADAG